MSKFIKLLLTLIFILIIEIALIIFGLVNKNTYSAETYIENYNPEVPIVILIDVTTNELGVFQNNILLKTYRVAGGKPTTPSPIGVWNIVHKDTWGEGFGGHWMGLNVPWGKYGIHGTKFPDTIGWNASKGCIRMRNNEVAELYKVTQYGTKVIIWGGPYGGLGSYLRTLKPGMRGSDVYEIQKLLKNKGYYKANPDGIYGEYLKNVIHKFQKDNELLVTDTLDNNFYCKLGINLVE